MEVQDGSNDQGCGAAGGCFAVDGFARAQSEGRHFGRDEAEDRVCDGAAQIRSQRHCAQLCQRLGARDLAGHRISDGTAYANNFFNNTVFGIETAAHQNDYNLIITNGAAAFGGISSVERLIAGKKVDGVVLPISLVTGELLRRIEDLSVPCVILGRSEEVGAEANWVDINNVQAGRRAVRLLLERGYKKIAFLSDGDGEVFNQDRIAGYRRELAAHHLSVPDGFILHGLPTVGSGMDCVRALLQGDDAPDAVICSDDRLALGALRAAHQLGLRVPEQFGIISCDNTPLTELAETPITSVDVDTFALGVQAAQILIEQIEDPQTSLRQILLSTKLIERASTMRETREETEAIHI